MTTEQILIAFTILAACGLPLGLLIYSLFVVLRLLRRMDVEIDEDAL